MRFNEHGDGFQKIEGGREWAYPARGFTGIGVICGRAVRCLTPEVQVICHAGYELKESDAHDMLALHERFGVDLLRAQWEAIGSLKR